MPGWVRAHCELLLEPEHSGADRGGADAKRVCRGAEIARLDEFDEAFTSPAKGAVDGFLLLLWFAQKSGSPADFALINEYGLARTAGLVSKKNEPSFLNFVNQTLLKLEASGEAAKIFDKWFAPSASHFSNPARLRLLQSG